MNARDLRGEARRAWDALHPKLVAAGLFLPVDEVVLVTLCRVWALYVAAVQRTATAAPRDRASWERYRDDLARDAREFASLFFVLPRERIGLAVMGPGGIDADLARLFRPGAPLRVRLTPDEQASLDYWNKRHAVQSTTTTRPKGTSA